MAMNPHNIRCDDERWDRAVARAANEGTNLSTRVREWIEDYADTGRVGDSPKIRLTADELELALRIASEQGFSAALDAINKGR